MNIKAFKDRIFPFYDSNGNYFSEKEDIPEVSFDDDELINSKLYKEISNIDNSIQPSYRNYVQGYGFLSFARKFGNKYDKKLINTGISFAKKFSTSKYIQKIIFK